MELVRPISRYQRSREILDGRLRREPAATTVTGADGGYRLAVPEPGMWQVEISAPGRVPVRRELFPLLESLVLPAATLAPDAGAEIRVVDAAGRPVAGARVRLQAVEGDERQGRGRRAAWEERGRFGMTDAGGRLRLSRRPGQRLVAHAFARGFVPSDAVPVEGGGAVIVLSPGTAQSIRFLTADGEPVAGAVVGVGVEAWEAALTDDDGRARLFLRQGEPLAFSVRTASGQWEERELTASAAGFESNAQRPLKVTLPAPAVLTGRVIDLDTRAAVPRAWVWVASDESGFVRTDPTGRYRLVDGSKPSGRLRLRAAAPGYRLAEASWERTAEADRMTTLALARQQLIEGRVVDLRGRGIAGAQVTVLSIAGGSWMEEMDRLATGADGGFRLRGLAPLETYQVRARARAYAPATTSFRPADGGLLELALEPGLTVTGRLVGEGREPISDAGVALVTATSRLRSSISSHLQARTGEEGLAAGTDPDGVFVLADLPARPMALVARKEGFLPLVLPEVDLAGRSGVVDLGELVLDRGTVLRGVVRDGEGSPVQGAQVQAEVRSALATTLRDLLTHPSHAAPLTTDAGGAFTVEGVVLGELVSLRVEHPEYVPWVAEVRSLGSEAAASSKAPIEIVLERGSMVSGWIEGEEGEPIEGAVIEITPLAPALSGRGRESSSRGPVQGRSGPDGAFSLGGLPPGRVELSVRHQSLSLAQPVELDLAAGEQRRDLRLRLSRGLELSGVVADRSGRPVVGATVSLARGGGVVVAFARTDGDGRYSLAGLSPADRGLVIQVRHPEYVPYEGRARLGVEGARLDVILDRGGSVSGLLSTPAGEPVGGAVVLLQGEQMTSSGSPTTLTLADGSFEIQGVEPGRYHLSVDKEGFAPYASGEAVVVPDYGLSGLTIHLLRGGTLRGRILGLEPGELSRVQVRAVGEAGQRTDGWVGGDGEYQIPWLGAAQGSVIAIDPGSGRLVREAFSLDPDGGEAWVDLEFPGGGVILSGTVVRNGEPWPAAHVAAAREGGGPHGGAWTSMAGRFEIRSLATGRYRLTIAGEDGPAHGERVELRGDTEITVEVARARVTGLVVDAGTGEPIPGAEVLARAEGARVSTHAGPSGVFTVDLPVGAEALLRARAASYSEASLPLHTGPGGELSGLELALDRGDEVEVEVRLWSGRRPGRIHVALVDGAGNRVLAEDRAARGGLYRLTTAPAGVWTLLVAAEGGAVATVPVSVPGPPVAVTLPPESRIQVDLSGLAGGNRQGRLRLRDLGGAVLRIPMGQEILDEWPVGGSERLIPFVPPGDWVVELADGSGGVWQKTVRTVAGATTRVVFP